MGLLDAPTKGEVKIDEQKTETLNDKQLAHFRNKKLGLFFKATTLSMILK
jgi:putative ABC transport system ATP-binding protein